MTFRIAAFVAAILIPPMLGSCRKAEESVEEPSPPTAAEQKAIDAGLQPVRDAPMAEIIAYRHKVRKAYNQSRFDELEREAEAALRTKARFGNGTWRIYQFYDSLGCSEEDSESMWRLHDKIHKAWIAAKPGSGAARIAHAEFLVEYAWLARGHGYADEVTEEGRRLFMERIEAADGILTDAEDMAGKDPFFWTTAMEVAKCKGVGKDEFDRIMVAAAAVEPAFFETDKVRASTLLPRWYGDPGDWEEFAEQAAERPGGVGDEVYARIVIQLKGFYKDVFQQTKASWPRTREGLELMCERYPDSDEVRAITAYMAVLARDRKFAKESFDRLGDDYYANVWRSPERFLHCREWMETGK